MNSTSRNLLTVILSFPVIALIVRYLFLWDQLPPSLAIHFDFQGTPDSWLESGLFFALMTVWLVAQVVIFYVLARYLDTALPNVFSIVHFAVSGVVFSTTWFLLDYNLDESSIPWLWVAAIGLVSGVIPPFLVASKNKGERNNVHMLKQSIVLYEETHRSLVLTILILAIFALIISTSYWLQCPIPIIALLGITGVLITAFNGYGFRYRFTEEGIEVRHLLGTSLFISFAAIEIYGPDKCRPLKDFGGWGIRVGKKGKAYIWQGHDALRVKFDNSIVYLGHHHPESLVRKLDEIMERRA